MKHKRRQQGPGALDLIEESVHLLRTAPAATLAVYYLGAMPFVLGMLFFWADMSRSPFASGHLADASLGMGILFLWMKFWQAIFARRVRAQRAAQRAAPLRFRQAAGICLAQIILQPSGLFLIPLSALPVLPFAWVYSFYQNITALSDGESGVARVLKKSWNQAGIWPRQNWLALVVLIGFGYYVFLNWTTVGLSLPAIFKMLFGIESKFTESPWSLLNSTFFAAMFGLTYLSVDPIFKTFFALRCFYGESLQSGEDLKAELKEFSGVLPKVAAIACLCSALAVATPAIAAQSAGAGPSSPSTIASSQLDGAINRTIHQNKYLWRMPREKFQDTDANESILGRFFDKVGDLIRRWSRAVMHVIGKSLNALVEWLYKWWKKLFGGRAPANYHSSTGYGWITSAQILLWTLVAVVASVLAIFLYRVWHGRRKARSPVITEAILPAPDLADENTAADQLPEEEWTRLGRELLARGESRLAMRAFYLASLAHLSARNLISIARFKSNREYERELRRRGHSFPELLAVFGKNLEAFEASWYGMHDVNTDSVSQFALAVERIKIAG